MPLLMRILWAVTAVWICGLPVLAADQNGTTVEAPKPPVWRRTVHRAGVTQIDSLPLPADVQPSAPQPCWTLADVEAMALRQNPSLAAAGARIAAAQGGQVQAGLYPNPVVGYHATQIGNNGTSGQQGGFVSQRFITGGKLGLDEAIAGRQVLEAQARFNAQKQRVLSDVRARFFDALVAQRRVELSRELADIGDNLTASTEKLLQGRLVSQNDLLQSEIEAEQSRIVYDNALNQEAESWRRLAAVTGAGVLPRAPLAGDLDEPLPDYDWESCYARIVTQSPELATAAARVSRARLAVTRARRENVPDVDVWVSFRQNNLTQGDVTNIQAGIPLPIFNKNQGNIARAQSELGAARSEVRRIELKLQDSLAVAYRRFSNARQQALRYRRRILPRAQQSLDLSREGYRQGQVDYLTLITSQRTFVRVNLAYLESLRELWAAWTRIEGQLLDDSLADRAVTR